MASQSQGIKLIHNPDSSGYRLLELPPDLVNLLESDTAPVSVSSLERARKFASNHFLIVSRSNPQIAQLCFAHRVRHTTSARRTRPTAYISWHHILLRICPTKNLLLYPPFTRRWSLMLFLKCLRDRISLRTQEAEASGMKCLEGDGDCELRKDCEREKMSCCCAGWHGLALNFVWAT